MPIAVIEQVKSLVARGEVSRSGLARAAGLHANSLRSLGDAKKMTLFRTGPIRTWFKS